MSHKYLDYIKEHNKNKQSICSECPKKAIDIIAVKHRVQYACQDHFISRPICILDLSDTHVLHYTYPQGVDYWTTKGNVPRS